ncbi:MAG: TIGR01841 family phasin [Paracoccaceae bacterium]|nr:TIGR01841 family phasin [Paracoccaceae bacterium]
MTAKDFPFLFDAENLKEMFGAAKLPALDTEALMAAHQKNVDAMIEANKVVFAGYQDLYKRQVALFEAAVADAKDKVGEIQGQPLTAERAAENVQAMRTAFEKAATEVKELADMAQKANTEAFEIVKARAEEAMAEFKTAADKLAA